MNRPAPPPTDPQDSARSYGATAGGLTAALAVSGVLTYVYFALASHSLDADAYGALVVLWSGVFIVVSIVFRPVELLLSRTISERLARDLDLGPTLRTAASIQLGCAFVVVALAVAFRGQIEDQLLDGRGALYAVMLGAIVAYSGSYFARGLTAGLHRFRLFALLLMIESSARLIFAVAVAVGLADGVDLVALGVVVGPALSLCIIPFALRDRGTAASTEVPEQGVPDGDALTLSRGAILAGSLLMGLLGEQVLLTTGPLFVRADAGTAAAGFMFNIMLVARAPALLFQAVAASLLPHLTRLRSGAEESANEAFRLSVRLTIAVAAGFSLVLVAAVLAVGPQVMAIAFGDDFDYDRLGLAYVGIGLGFYLAAQTLNQAAIARGRARAAAVCWAPPAIAFVLFNLSGALDAFRRVELGFAGASALLFAGLLVLYLGDRDEPAPSAAELAGGPPV